MLKNVTYNNKDKEENKKLSKVKSKRKSKSINKNNYKKEKILRQNLPINVLIKQNKKNKGIATIFPDRFNYNKKSRKDMEIFNKRNTRIEIDANKPNINIKRDDNIKIKKEVNKENYLTEKIKGKNIINSIKSDTNYNSFDTKGKKLNKIKEDEIEKNNDINVNKENIEKQNEEKERLMKNEEIQTEVSNNDYVTGEYNKNKIENKEEKIEKTPQKKLSSKNNLINENSISKMEVPLLQLNNINMSSSLSSEIKKGESALVNEITESSYDSKSCFEIKGEYLSKNEKKKFLNEIKKSLFNNNVNMKDNYLKSKKLEKLNKINLRENLSITDLQNTENNININYSYITKEGLDDKKKKINQDSYLILDNVFENLLNIFGIFDGHGKNGHLISSLVSSFLSKYLKDKENYYIKEEDNSDSNSDSSDSSKEIIINKELISNLFSNETFIKNLIREIDIKVNECNFDLQFSGTTCLLLFIINKTLICSNIGDSMCVLFNCSDEDRWTYEIISVIHKPDIQSEKERIIINGGVIHPYYNEYGITEGPNRVYAKGKTYPGLSLTRTIGDLEGEKIGIISEPDIIIKKIDSTCKYLVMGSDGLWDVIKPYDVRRIVTPFFIKNDPNGACQALLKTASKKWDKDECDRDDITIIIIFIGIPNEIN